MNKDETGGASGIHGTNEACVHSFRQKSVRQLPDGRPQHRWQGDIKMYLNSI